jgi:phosphoglycolate/pyridoxal phosphate phosphatase family
MDKSFKRLNSFSEIIDKYESFIFDCDGTLWSASKKYEEAFKTLELLKSKGKKIYFLTNATHRSRKEYQQKLKRFGFETGIEYIYNASYLAVSYIKLVYPEIKKIYIIGMKPPVDDALELGLQVVGGPDHNNKFIESDEDFLHIPVEDDIDGVLVAFDFGFNYYKLAYASLCIQKGAKLFATNEDAFDNIGQYNLPRAGCALKALEKATQKTAIILGKPNAFGMETLKAQHDLDLSKTVMIGDNIDTDILFGINCGIDTVLVLTGVSNEDTLKKQMEKEKPIFPTYVCRNLE